MGTVRASNQALRANVIASTSPCPWRWSEPRWQLTTCDPIGRDGDVDVCLRQAHRRPRRKARRRAIAGRREGSFAFADRGPTGPRGLPSGDGSGARSQGRNRSPGSGRPARRERSGAAANAVARVVPPFDEQQRAAHIRRSPDGRSAGCLGEAGRYHLRGGLPPRGRRTASRTGAWLDEALRGGNPERDFFSGPDEPRLLHAEHRVRECAGRFPLGDPDR